MFDSIIPSDTPFPISMSTDRKVTKSSDVMHLSHEEESSLSITPLQRERAGETSIYMAIFTILHSVASVPHTPTMKTGSLPDQRKPGIASQWTQFIRKETLFTSVNMHLYISVGGTNELLARTR